MFVNPLYVKIALNKKGYNCGIYSLQMTKL